MVVFSHTFSTIDSHTAGEPTRIILSGFPPFRGRSMAEKLAYARKNMDQLRQWLVREPRGHRDMFGAILTAPTSPDADWGLLFMDNSGFPPMCGHGTIGTAIVVTELGLVERHEPETVIRFDTAFGLVTVHVEIRDGRVRHARFENVAAFLYAEAVNVDVPQIGMIDVDVSFGGDFFAIVSGDQLGVRVEPGEAHGLVKMALEIRRAVNEQIRVQHPEHPREEYFNRVDNVLITAAPTQPEARARNVVIFGEGSLDRSPCGTGTSARMAQLYAKGKLRVGEPFIHEGITNTLFRGKLLRETRVGGLKAVVPEVGGMAYITGINQWVMDPEDPCKQGFVI